MPQDQASVEHVAWCRWIRQDGKPTRIDLCDSDAEGAFPVYSWSEMLRCCEAYNAIDRQMNSKFLSAYGKLFEHVNDDGTLKGTGQWRLKAVAEAMRWLKEAYDEALQAEKILCGFPQEFECRKEGTPAIFTRLECPFNYCDQEPPHTACESHCHHHVETKGN